MRMHPLAQPPAIAGSHDINMWNGITAALSDRTHKHGGVLCMEPYSRMSSFRMDVRMVDANSAMIALSTRTA
ncbi:hypothetical protein RHOFW104R3_16385 [Rhodanobacter denitrificans]|nr:hypothetical protein RHOFW104R3_16385 [Rhodanobacter denitrificans]